MTAALAERPPNRRRATERMMAWNLPQKNVLSEHSPPANDQSDPPGELDWLDDKIGAQHDHIATLMHERNACPEDKDVASRLQDAFDALRVMQHERADRMSTYFYSKSSVVFDEVSDTVKKARDILKQYENTSLDDTAIKGSLLSKP